MVTKTWSAQIWNPGPDLREALTAELNREDGVIMRFDERVVVAGGGTLVEVDGLGELPQNLKALLRRHRDETQVRSHRPLPK